MSEQDQALRDAEQLGSIRAIRAAARNLLLACTVASDAISLNAHIGYDVALAAEPDMHHMALLGAISFRDDQTH